jgi:excisionase family DNA binding protein
MLQNMLNIEQIAERLSIGRGSAYKLAKQLKHVKIGRRIYVPKVEIDKYIMAMLK